MTNPVTSTANGIATDAMAPSVTCTSSLLRSSKRKVATVGAQLAVALNAKFTNSKDTRSSMAIGLKYSARSFSRNGTAASPPGDGRSRRPAFGKVARSRISAASTVAATVERMKGSRQLSFPLTSTVLSIMVSLSSAVSHWVFVVARATQTRPKIRICPSRPAIGRGRSEKGGGTGL